MKLVEAFPYAGTSNAVLQVDRGLVADPGRYRCVVRGKCGMAISPATTLAGVLDGGGLVLALASEPVAGRPGLSLSWSGGGAVLESASSPMGPWTAVPGAAQSPYAPSLTGAVGFSRLRAAE